ncbi:hypothetical protein [Chengkuizengella marina]|uniref:Uncharacterized protein n=1 Tax=Chengkuizengella marina TaxID=2507566 RepID=A0A6N9Q8H1_9BACL|nr:hypothetical protein [Chengkuizengella marina]NBI31119.1 hypothetical protein [Chengkuizengella marina]
MNRKKSKSIIIEKGFNIIMLEILLVSILAGAMLKSWWLFGILLIGLLFIYHKENFLILKTIFSLAWGVGFYFFLSQFEQGVIICSIGAIIGFIGSWLVHSVGFTSDE